MSIIKIIGGIDEDAYGKFSDALDEYGDSKPGIIDIELYSEGGDDLVALAFLDRMRLSKHDFRVTVFGYAASAATLILAAGAPGMRRVTANAWVMVHESSEETEGSTTKIERWAREMRRREAQWCRLLEIYTKRDAKFWAELNARGDTYLTARQCVTLGLADEVI